MYEDFEEYVDFGYTPKQKIFASISGGLSSATMAALLQESMSETHDIKYVFANTGLEHEETLIFVDKLDKDLGLNLIWVEADVKSDGVGTRHKQVTFETASRWENWESGDHPFLHVSSKYGVPHRGRRHCTRELKLAPMYSFINQQWPERNYEIAIGIRADEKRRRSKNQYRDNILYPLMSLGYDKQDVNTFWEGKSYTLNIPEELGNCIPCFNKSLPKLAKAYKAVPMIFEIPRFVEKVNTAKGVYRGELVHGIQTMYQGWRNTDSLLELMKSSKLIEASDMPDQSGTCGEECGGLDLAGYFHEQEQIAA